MFIESSYIKNSLKYDPELCTGCGMCRIVCPHGVFKQNDRKAELNHSEDCMECGACSINCPAGAISVESGVGCAYAMIYAALTGKKEPTCGIGDDDPTPCRR